MNLLFVNYGDFRTNSLNHIAGFANALCAAGHACIVVVPHGKDTISAIRDPLFIAASADELLAKPGLFPDGKPADVIHAWTPREAVRKFVLAYQRLLATPARLIIHLEDNERFLIEAYTGKSFAALCAESPHETSHWLVDGLPHPLRHENFLRIADGVTHIVDKLKEFIPAGTPAQLLPPPLDLALYAPQPADKKFRAELGLRADEKVVVFTGSNTFVNEPEMRELYLAVALLNQRGVPTRLVRTGFNSPTFLDGLAVSVKAHVLDLGFVEKAQLPKLLALADVLVQPGRPGAFNDYRLPSKLPEFLASGRPVILPPTNLAAQMRDGHEALFLKTGAPAEIADLCQKIFADPKLTAELGKNGVAFARAHFDTARNTRTLADFYAAVRTRPATANWSLARDPFATETTLVAAQLAAAAPVALAAGLGDFAQTIRQLELAVDTSRGALAQLLAQKEEILKHTTLRDQLSTQHAHNLEEALRQAQQHSRTLEQARELTAAHVDHLERTVASLRPQLDRSEQLRVQAETLLQSARTQIYAFEQEMERMDRAAEAAAAEAKARLDRSETNLRNSEREAAYYKRLLHEQIAEARAVADRAAAAKHALRLELHHAHATLAARDEKLRRMTTSFSWRATAWLRSLRRTLIDPRRPQPAPPPLPAAPVAEAPDSIHALAPLTLRFSVDYPNTWSFPPKKVLIRGWCFASESIALKHLRATVNGRRYPGVYGLKRLDVLAALRDCPQAEYCGWKVEVELTHNDTDLLLEIGDEHGGWHAFFSTPIRVGDDLGPIELTNYEKWAVAFDRHTEESLKNLAVIEHEFHVRPTISVVMPVYNTPEKWLVKAVESVRAQVYQKWELCLADDASPSPHVRPLLEKLAASDPRIKVTFREKNGHISAASNSALELATGEFIALLDHDDELSPNALHEIVAQINVHPDSDLIYSDEDKIDEEGRRHEPYFKPDWLPDLFHAQNFISHLTVYRAALVREVGGFRVGYEGSQDWDLALRVIERIKDQSHIRHLPKVLYHWRAIAGSTALMLSEKNYPLEAARRALTDAFARRGEKITLHHVPGDHWRVQYPLPAEPPLVSLIIPTRNGLKFLQRCVDSILEKTTYPNYEIIIVDNGSDDPAALAYLDSLAKGTHASLTPRHRARVLRYDAPFNFSAINNFAVAQASGELVGLLNNDLEVITPGWLDEMAAQALRPGIGCVGAMLYYPNDTIQHAGAIIGLGGVAGHAFRDFPRGTEGKFNRARLVQNYSAVTAACLLIRKSTYLQVEGLDEKNLTIAFNDIDFCLKVRAAGYRNLWTPFAELYHHESVSRGAEDTPEKHERFRSEVEYMLKRWPEEIRHDPAYNPNLTLELTDFTLAAPPRPWSPA